MSKEEYGWGKPLVIVVFASIAGLYGLFGMWVSAILVLIAPGRFEWPLWGYLVLAALLHLITAALCGFTTIRRLDDRPVLLSGFLGITLAIVTPLIARLWFPDYYFLGI
jgi:hypothetical protein